MLGSLACLASAATVCVGAWTLILRPRLGPSGRRRAARALLAVAGLTGLVLLAGLVASARRALADPSLDLTATVLAPTGWFVLLILLVAPALEIARALERDHLPPPDEGP